MNTTENEQSKQNHKQLPLQRLHVEGIQRIKSKERHCLDYMRVAHPVKTKRLESCIYKFKDDPRR